MNVNHGAAVDRIQSVYAEVVARGLRPETMTGASDEEIDQFVARQGVNDIPDAVREVFRLIGASSGLWFAGTSFGVRSGIDSSTKRHAIASLNGIEHGIRDTEGMLVLTDHQSYAFHVIDGADLRKDDPPVWTIVENESAFSWPSLSDWFSGTEPIIENYREKLEMLESSGAAIPFWAEYIEPRWARTPPASNPVDRVQEIIDSVYDDGLSRDATSGADDQAIDNYASVQSVASIPIAVREIFRHIGSRHSLWFKSAKFGVHEVDSATKSQALATVRAVKNRMHAPESMLVLAANPGYDYFAIDGEDLALDDPPVWAIHESEYVRKNWGSTTGWLAENRPRIDQYRRVLERFEEQGRPAPAWAPDIS